MRRLNVVAWPAFKNKQKNPYNHLLYSKLVGMGIKVTEHKLPSMWMPMDVFHVHWPEDYSNKTGRLRAMGTLTVLILTGLNARIRSAKVVWTAHNVEPHEGLHPVLDRVYKRTFGRLITDVIHLTNSGKLNFLQSGNLQLKKSTRHHIVPHGPYPVSPSSLEAGGIRTALILGQIRPYKMLVEFVDVWNRANVAGWTLKVAGSGSGSVYAHEVASSIARNPNATFVDKWLTDDEVSRLLAECHLMVVTGRRHNSGALFLGLSAGRKVLIRSSSTIREIQETVGSQWVLPYTGDISVSSLTESLKSAASDQPTEIPDLADWSEIAIQTISVYG